MIPPSQAWGSPAGVQSRTMMHDGDFPVPDLRFVPIENLVPHERHDAHRMEPLVRQLRDEGLLKNPPVVAPLSWDAVESADALPRYVVLDGANRASAAAAAGFPHMLVQVVRYAEPHVHLATWYHALSEFEPRELEAALERIGGLECRMEERVHGRALLARREALACVAFGGTSVMTLTGGGDLESRNALLNQVVDIYRRRAFYRVTSDAIEPVRQRYPDVTALLVFPHFEPDEILELALSGARLPAGITRHLIRWRALRVNLPIERLADRGESPEQKNEWLRHWLAERVATRHVRFYEEPTVLFDE